MRGGCRPKALPPGAGWRLCSVPGQRCCPPAQAIDALGNPAPRLLPRPAGATLDALGARLAAPARGAGRVSLVPLSKMAAAGFGGAAGSGGAE